MEKLKTKTRKPGKTSGIKERETKNEKLETTENETKKVEKKLVKFGNKKMKNCETTKEN